MQLFPRFSLALLALGSVALMPLDEAQAQSGPQGACPAGYFEIEGVGWKNCAPLPSNAAPPADLGPKWQTRWGAIVVGLTPNGSELKASSGQASRRKAEKQALSDCKKMPGVKDCRVEISYYNQCGVIAWGDNYYHTARAGTKSDASAMALEGCSEKTTNCRIFYADCSYPIRIR